MTFNAKFLFAATLSAALTGCAGVPADWGRSEVARMTADHGLAQPRADDVRAFTVNALREPLTADVAIQLALINNPAVRRETARLGFAAAEVYEAGRLANPVFSLTHLSGDSSSGANTPQLTLGVAFNFVNLLFLPANSRFARAQFEAAKLGVGAAVLDLAVDVEAAWYEAVGTDQLAQMRDAAARAGRASADLAQRYFEAGNIGPRELAMEQAAASTAALAAISARAEALGRRIRLNRLMGLDADQNAWTLGARLAEPVPLEDDSAELQRLGRDARLDVASLRRRAQAIADRYGFTRRTRWVGGIEVGVERERDFDGAIDAGPTLSLELPLFNWGGGRTASIQAALDQAEAELDERVLDVSNQIQLGSARVAAARALAEEYRRVLIPQREAIVARAQEQQNYMLIGIFEVILVKQQEYEAYAGYIGAVRDYWIARTELARAVGRRLPSSDQAITPALDAVEVLEPHPHGDH
ncbi:MAG: TolC family protein [Panacagrimonas sp.]